METSIFIFYFITVIRCILNLAIYLDIYRTVIRIDNYSVYCFKNSESWNLPPTQGKTKGNKRDI